MQKLTGEVAVVLSDIRLSESNDDDRHGLELIRTVRTRRPDLPIVAMSALDSPDVAQASLSAGANRFLRKPIVVTELRKLLADLLEPHL